MKSRAVIVDVAIDQGGCAGTSRPTTHSHPTYILDDVVHYCVTNMPGAVARTSTFALSNVTTSFVVALADKGLRQALSEDPHCAMGSTCTRAASLIVSSPMRSSKTTRMLMMRCGFNGRIPLELASVRSEGSIDIARLSGR
jgi:alanine dehydrogenase